MLTQEDCLGRRAIHYAALRGASVSCMHMIKVCHHQGRREGGQKGQFAPGFQGPQKLRVLIF